MNVVYSIFRQHNKLCQDIQEAATQELLELPQVDIQGHLVLQVDTQEQEHHQLAIQEQELPQLVTQELRKEVILPNRVDILHNKVAIHLQEVLVTQEVLHLWTHKLHNGSRQEYLIRII